MRRVLFRRDFQNFTGGHLKVWDYFKHTSAAPDHGAEIYFTPETRWDAANPWLPWRAQALSQWAPGAADVIFLGGADWLALPDTERRHFGRPVINLIQHVRHGDLADPLAEHLPNRAIRICVSAEVEAAVLATGRVNGPTVVIPNGVDVSAVRPALAHAERPIPWLICGVKEGQPAVARDLGRRMAPLVGAERVEVVTKPLPRGEFLDLLAQTRRAILLPRLTEGFYLPALEAMALGTLVICADCVGNRGFCRDGRTAIVPVSGEVDALLEAVVRVRSLGAAEESAILGNARAMAVEHSLARERAAFHELLAAVPSLW
jgi:glycosyltransferase involved in cell wall biosynthesis